MKESVPAVLQKYGAAAVGIIGRGTICAIHDENTLERIQEIMPGWNSLIIAAYPYSCARSPKGISMYAAAQDYHKVLPPLLGPAAAEIEKNGFSARIMTDASPFDERACAAAAGIGIRGDNGLVIVPGWGSYVFLAEILTDAKLADDNMQPKAEQCAHCGACIRACPYGALSEKGFDREKCLSELSQRRHLTDRQLEMLRESGVIWGCDRCQAACPHNANVPETEIVGFRENRLTDEDIDMMSGITNSQFMRKYGRYALAWRAAGVLRRNIANIKGR